MVIILGYRYHIRYYETDYFGKLSLSRVCRYDTLISVWGEPNEIVVLSYAPNIKNGKKYCLNAVYNEFSVNVHSDYDLPHNNDEVYTYKIYSEKFRFGRYSIGIGSSKTEVESAYQKSYKVQQIMISENKLCYMDKGHTYAEYFFDENNLVKEVCIFWW